MLSANWLLFTDFIVLSGDWAPINGAEAVEASIESLSLDDETFDDKGKFLPKKLVSPVEVVGFENKRPLKQL